MWHQLQVIILNRKFQIVTSISNFLFEDGFTRDRKESLINLASDIVPVIGSTVKVCVTCIVPETSARFGAGSLIDLKKEMNADEMVKQYKPFVGLPSELIYLSRKWFYRQMIYLEILIDLLDLVLVKRGNEFYRARVMEQDEVSLDVHFLDYGYTEPVTKKSIFHWYPRWNSIPGKFDCSDNRESFSFLFSKSICIL